jgi:hypothetical protein
MTPEFGLQQILKLRRSSILEFHRFMTLCLHGLSTSGLRRFEILQFRRFVTSGLRRLKIPKFRRFATSRLHRFKILEFRRFATSGLRRFKIPKFRRFATSVLRRFKILDLPIINYPESSFHEFRQTRCFEGDRFFLNSLTLAPRGSGLTPLIRFHENL